MTWLETTEYVSKKIGVFFFRGAGQIHANNFLTERERHDDAKEVK